MPGDTGYHAVRPKGGRRLPSGRTDFYAYSFLLPDLAPVRSATCDLRDPDVPHDDEDEA